MKNGLKDCTHEIGISQPRISRFRRVSEYRVMTVNCCWNSAKNAAVPMNSGMKDTTRERSSESSFFEASRIAKMTTAPTMASAATTVARFWAFSTPVAASTATRTTTPTAIPAQSGYLERGSGSGTWCTLSGRPLRVSTYWIRPTAMPTAARPKPRWKPHCCCAKPVTSGPSRPPMFTPM